MHFSLWPPPFWKISHHLAKSTKSVRLELVVHTNKSNAFKHIDSASQQSLIKKQEVEFLKSFIIALSHHLQTLEPLKHISPDMDSD